MPCRGWLEPAGSATGVMAFALFAVEAVDWEAFEALQWFAENLTRLGKRRGLLVRRDGTVQVI